MTTITRPPLVPLFTDNDADLFAGFSPSSGTPLPCASIIGLRSSDMSPRVGFSEFYPSPGSSFSIGGAFAAIPSSAILVGRQGAGATSANAFMDYRMDGRVIRSNTVGLGPSLVNAYPNGRALARISSAQFSTVDPTTLVAAASDVVFQSGSGFTASNVTFASADVLGNVCGLFNVSNPPDITKILVCWSSTGTVKWTQTLTVPGYAAATSAAGQIEADSLGNWNIVLDVTDGEGSHGQTTLTQYAGPSGAQNWTVTLGTTYAGVYSIWVAKTGNIYVAGTITGGQNVWAYNSGGGFLWQTEVAAVNGISICEASGLLLVGTQPFTSSGKVTNLWSVAQASGAVLNQWGIGPTSIGYSLWLEPRAGRVGTFG